MRRLAPLPLLMLAATGGCNKPAPQAPQAPAAPQAAAPAVGAIRVDRSNAGKAIPAAAFQGPDGRPLKLADLKGRPVLLNLWATWCVPCIKELPTLDALAQRAGDKLQVLTVSEDLEGARVVRPFLAKRGFKALKPYGDTSNALMLGLKEAGLPVTVLYGADGKEVWRVRSGADWNGRAAQALLAEAGA